MTATPRLRLPSSHGSRPAFPDCLKRAPRHRPLALRATLSLAGALLALAWHGPAAAQSTTVGFTEVDLSGAVPGELYEMADGMGGGLAAADYDNDGDVDIFLPNEEAMLDRLLRNNGDGTFTDVAEDVGVDGLPTGLSLSFKPRSRVALWVDYDGDRRLDLLVIGDCWDCPVTFEDDEVKPDDPIATLWSLPRLFRQRPDGNFVDVTVAAGLSTFDFLQDCQACEVLSNAFRHIGGLAAGDLNDDDLPDLFVGHWSGTSPFWNEPNNGRVFLSDAAAGDYTDGEELIGAAGTPADMDPLGSHWQTVFHDFDDDGALDVFNALDGNRNTLWLNSGAPLGAFTDDAEDAGVEHGNDIFASNGGFDMGVGVGDYNNDGFFDLYLTNTNGGEEFTDLLLRAEPGLPATAEGTVVFSDQTDAAGILPFVGPSGGGSQPGQSWGWGVTFFDANLDGWQDLAITNGFSAVPGLGGTWPNQAEDPSLFFQNTIPLQPTFPFLPDFVEQSDAWSFNDEAWGSALAALDFDRDGDPDLAQTTQNTYAPDPLQPSEFRLLRNDFESGAENPPRWLIVRPRLTTANSHSLGAVVRVTLEYPTGDPLVLSRLITAGVSFMTQEPAEAHFGLGSEEPTTVTVTIEWPDGRPDSEFTVTELDRVITYGWCNDVDFESPFGVLDQPDLDTLVELYEAEDPRVDFVAPFGVVNFSDLVEGRNRFVAGCPTDTVAATDLP